MGCFLIHSQGEFGTHSVLKGTGNRIPKWRPAWLFGRSSRAVRFRYWPRDRGRSDGINHVRAAAVKSTRNVVLACEFNLSQACGPRRRGVRLQYCPAHLAMRRIVVASPPNEDHVPARLRGNSTRYAFRRKRRFSPSRRTCHLGLSSFGVANRHHHSACGCGDCASGLSGQPAGSLRYHLKRGCFVELLHFKVSNHSRLYLRR
jgi:hypothetical protein